MKIPSKESTNSFSAIKNKVFQSKYFQSKVLIKRFNQKIESKASIKAVNEMKYCLHHSGPHNTTPREDMSNKVGITHLFSGSPLRDLVISNINDTLPCRDIITSYQLEC